MNTLSENPEWSIRPREDMKGLMDRQSNHSTLIEIGYFILLFNRKDPVLSIYGHIKDVDKGGDVVLGTDTTSMLYVPLT